MAKPPPSKLARPFADALRGVVPEKRGAAAPKKTFAGLYDEHAAAVRPDANHAAPKAGAAARATHAPRPDARLHDRSPGQAASTEHVHDEEALHDAFTGVTPLARSGPERVPNLPPGTDRLRRGAMPSYRDVDAEVRRRLGELVAGDVAFRMGKRDDDFLYGVREDAEDDAWEPLARSTAIEDDTLDLHGLRALEAESATVRFVRSRFRRGARLLRIVHGKGLHSEAGMSVLRDAVITALTERGAAPLVYAFATAHPNRGGSGAMLVALRAKY